MNTLTQCDNSRKYVFLKHFFSFFLKLSKMCSTCLKRWFFCLIFDVSQLRFGVEGATLMSFKVKITNFHTTYTTSILSHAIKHL